MRFLTKLLLFTVFSVYASGCFSSSGCKNPVTVAVIDTGIDASHALIKKNLWKKEKSNVYGWDFVTNKPNPSDDHGHGTHIAGIIAKVSKCSRIMALNYYDKESGVNSFNNSVKAIHYAVENGAKIINYSGGGPVFSEKELEALEFAKEKGVIVIAAAGNEKSNIDNESLISKYYPASYSLENIISVAAVNRKGELIKASNWGVKSVDVATYGSNIRSAFPKGKTATMSGTSQATAFVSAYVSNLLSKNPKMSFKSIRSHLVFKSKKKPALATKVRSGGVLEVVEALDRSFASTKK